MQRLLARITTPLLLPHWSADLVVLLPRLVCGWLLTPDLSRNSDVALTMVRPDSPYRTVVTYRTGYLVTEAKFTVNGEFEMAADANRVVRFASVGDTTVYRAVFGVPRPDPAPPR